MQTYTHRQRLGYFPKKCLAHTHTLDPSQNGKPTSREAKEQCTGAHAHALRALRKRQVLRNPNDSTFFFFLPLQGHDMKERATTNKKERD